MDADGDAQRKREAFERFARTRDAQLRDELVAEHLGLAEYLARRFANRGEPLDDLIQVASLGLIKALDRFEPSRGLAFSTFATPTIIGEIKRHFRDKGWSVRVPRRIQNLHLELIGVVSDLSQELSRSPTIPEIASAAQVSEEEVVEALDAGSAYRSTSLDASAGTDDEGALIDLMGSDDPELANAERRAALIPLLKGFEPRERAIVYLRFFEGLTQSEIARRLGISQMHVSRLLSRTLAEMRTSRAMTSGPGGYGERNGDGDEGGDGDASRA